MLSACQPLALLGLFYFMLSITQVGRSSFVNEDTESEFQLSWPTSQRQEEPEAGLEPRTSQVQTQVFEHGFHWGPPSARGHFHGFSSKPFTWSVCTYSLCFSRIIISQMGDAVHGKTNSTNEFTQKKYSFNPYPHLLDPFAPRKQLCILKMVTCGRFALSLIVTEIFSYPFSWLQSIPLCKALGLSNQFPIKGSLGCFQYFAITKEA